VTRPTGRTAFFTSAAFLFAFLCVLLAGCGDSGGSGNEGRASSSASGNSRGATPDELVFGFVPSLEADKIAESAQPMADFISKELGIPVKTITAT
jgi:phosphonate transport system substrate-binding protein